MQIILVVLFTCSANECVFMKALIGRQGNMFSFTFTEQDGAVRIYHCARLSKRREHGSACENEKRLKRPTDRRTDGSTARLYVFVSQGNSVRNGGCEMLVRCCRVLARKQLLDTAPLACLAPVRH